jgi:hypothetical protein
MFGGVSEPPCMVMGPVWPNWLKVKADFNEYFEWPSPKPKFPPEWLTPVVGPSVPSGQ